MCKIRIHSFANPSGFTLLTVYELKQKHGWSVLASKWFLVMSLESVFYYLLLKMIYFSLAALGLHCLWVFWGYSSCGAWASNCGLVSYCRAQALGCVDFSS